VLYIMAGLLVIGFIANFMVHPVTEKYWSASKSPAQSKAAD
jgi:hypothetical protein